MIQIICRLNDEDNFSVQDCLFNINLNDKKQYHWTFYQTVRRLCQFPNFFSAEALDLFYISLIVYYADRKVLRKDTFDSWTRSFKIYMPVLEPSKWNNQKKLLEQMVSFLSGDLWEFEFRKRELNNNELRVKKWAEKSNKNYTPSAFCMLSGGLDSFIGAIDLLSTEKNIAFIGHYGGGKGVIEYQNNVKAILSEQFKLADKQFFNFHAAPVGGIEDSTRTRSFMFFTHAIILASTLDKQTKLYIPENGLISLNIPLTNTRLGTSSTRTTHPFYMGMLQSLLNNLDIKVELENPYQFKTKGEMINQCQSPDFLKENISKTMSCSHPDQARYKKAKAPSHCGTCLPCVIRRAAIKKAYSTDSSSYQNANFNTGINAPIDLQSYKIGILDFKNSSSNTIFKIQESGPILYKHEEFEKVYLRGMNELAELLDGHNG
jgi:7-cyano-7-deazaguanine synthase in queuosine biosynthesis